MKEHKIKAIADTINSLRRQIYIASVLDKVLIVNEVASIGADLRVVFANVPCHFSAERAAEIANTVVCRDGNNLPIVPEVCNARRYYATQINELRDILKSLGYTINVEGIESELEDARKS